MLKKIIIVIIVLALLGAGVWFVKDTNKKPLAPHELEALQIEQARAYQEKMEREGQAEPQTQEESIQEEPIEDKDSMMEKEDEVMMQEKTSDSTPETTTLESTDPRGGTAVATREFDGQTFRHTVTAEVSDPQEGKFYEGWLVIQGSVPTDFFSTGAMTKNADGAWELTYNSDINHTEHSFVVITEETSADGLDNKPEAHIFEGLFN